MGAGLARLARLAVLLVPALALLLLGAHFFRAGSAAFAGLEFTGVTGKILIGADRSPRKAVVVVQAAGAFQFVEKILPE